MTKYTIIALVANIKRNETPENLVDTYTMAIPVVEFSREGYKIRKVFV